jgi:hypothetical protein
VAEAGGVDIDDLDVIGEHLPEERKTHPAPSPQRWPDTSSASSV